MVVENGLDGLDGGLDQVKIDYFFEVRFHQSKMTLTNAVDKAYFIVIFYSFIPSAKQDTEDRTPWST